MNASLEDITKAFSKNRFGDGEEFQFNLEKNGGHLLFQGFFHIICHIYPKAYFSPFVFK